VHGQADCEKPLANQRSTPLSFEIFGSLGVVIDKDGNFDPFSAVRGVPRINRTNTMDANTSTSLDCGNGW
jgi:hypothetical protein